MGHALDIWSYTIEVILSSLKMVFDEDFMMSMFDEFTNELHPYKDFLPCKFKEKQMDMVETTGSNSSVKIASRTTFSLASNKYW